MNRALITGATGYVGSNLAKRLVRDGLDVHTVLRPQSDPFLLRGILDKIHIHIHNGTTQGMLEIMEKARPEIVFHLSAFFVSEHSSKDVEPLVKSNILFGVQLLEGMRKSNVRYLVNAGTHWQHYNNEEYNPVDLYAATKQAFEDLARYFTQTTPLRMMTLKLIDTYGPNDPRPKIFSLLRHAVETGESLKMSLGRQSLGFVYIDDVVDAFTYSMEMIRGLPEHEQDDFVIAPEKYYTLREIVSLYERIGGRQIHVEWGAREYRNREMMLPYEGKPLTGWIPKIDLPEGISLMLNEEG